MLKEEWNITPNKKTAEFIYHSYEEKQTSSS